MPDVIDLYGVCEGEPCKKDERRITSPDDLIDLNGRKYHKGCEPPLANQGSSNV